MSDFHFSTPIAVRFRDMDGLGHVNNAVYLTYIEQARVEFAFYLLEGRRLEDVHFILASATVNYRKPAFFGDELRCYIRVGHIGNSSFTLEYEIRRGDELIADATSVQVWFDYKEGRSVRIPDSFRERVARLQTEGSA